MEVAEAMTRSLPATASSPWVAVIVNGEMFLVSNGTPGSAAHPEVDRRDALLGTVQAEDLDRDPELEHAIGSTSSTLTWDSAMPPA